MLHRRERVCVLGSVSCDIVDKYEESRLVSSNYVRMICMLWPAYRLALGRQDSEKQILRGVEWPERYKRPLPRFLTWPVFVSDARLGW